MDISDEAIYSFYMREKISMKKSYSSPFREEKIPSLTFAIMPSGSMVWRDWGDMSQIKPGNSMSFVMKYYNCSFVEAIHHLQEDFQKDYINAPTKSGYREKYHEKRSRNILVVPRAFNDEDIAFWSQYGISQKTLEEYDVIPADRVFYNFMEIKSYTPGKPVYAYLFRDNGNIYYKIYDPLNENRRYKWIYNGHDNIVLGYDQLNISGKLLILSKSLKDVMLLREFGFDAISLQSESSNLSKELFFKLKKRFEHIILFYDNDIPGIMKSRFIAKNYDLKEIFIPRISSQKDISDYVKRYGFNNGQILVNSLINELGDEFTI